MCLHLPLRDGDLLVQGGDDRDQAPGRWPRTQRSARAAGPAAGCDLVAAAGVLEHRRDLGTGQLRGTGRVRDLAQQLQRVRAARSSNAATAAGKNSRSWARSRCTCRARPQISVFACEPAPSPARPSPRCRDDPAPSHPRPAAASRLRPTISNPVSSQRENHQQTKEQGSRQAAGTTSQRRSALPDTGRGHVLGLRGSSALSGKVLTRPRPPANESAGQRIR